MPEYRRARIQGGTYFFTVVTYHRIPILTDEKARSILKNAWMNVMKRFPFWQEAVCLLPEHIHCVWTLPEGDSDYSVRWKEIKRYFTREYQAKYGGLDLPGDSRIKRGEGTLWQRRFWEHAIRDQEDLNRHLDYIHFNPVKHSLVKSVSEWPWSSFHRYVKEGYYAGNWGGAGKDLNDSKEFGE
ncbi:MAG: transposase [Anaerolinea sp.]|nr:transposase [Anaerolinea sp.]